VAERVDVAIRPAAEGDIEALTALSGELGYAATRGATQRRLQSIRARGDQALFVARAEPRGVVGWVHVFEALRLESEPFAEIGGLVVGSESRGRGVGSALVRAAADWGAARQLASLRVRSNVVRQGARAFYLRLGFEISKSQAVFVRGLGA
jgi:GNAT superfamily N-acetyltransferase